MIASAIGGIGMRQVRNAQQHLAQLFLNLVRLYGQSLFVVTQGPTGCLSFVGRCRIAIATRLTHLLRQFVDLGADVVAFGRDFAGPNIESNRTIELFDDVGLATPGQGRSNSVGVIAEQSDVDHRDMRLPDPLSRPFVNMTPLMSRR